MAEDSTKPFRIGVALSGGGARGLAHAGALKALEEAGYHPDIIAGVSAGSVAAVLYAAGVKPDRILELFARSKFSDFCRLKISGRGILDMTRFRKLITRTIAPVCDIRDLRIPTYVCATDFDNGVPHAFSSGPAAERVVASCSIPIAFPPVCIDGTNYVDGGVLHNLPAWAIRDKCQYLIGINCSPQHYTPQSRNSLLDTALRSFHMLARANTIHDLELCDTVISTDDIADYRVFDLKGIHHCFRAGYEAARHAISAADIPPTQQTDIQQTTK